MSKQESIVEIRRLNPSAEARFLQQFDEKDLLHYRIRLEHRQERKGHVINKIVGGKIVHVG